MRRFISLLLMLVVMLLLTTSIVGAESPGAFDSKPGCGSGSPGNGKGKANGHKKNCENETDSSTDDTGIVPAPSTGSDITDTQDSGFNPTPNSPPNSASSEAAGLPSAGSGFTAESGQANAAPDCLIDEGVGLNKGAAKRCKAAATTFTENEIEQDSFDIRVACPGELIRLTGRFHYLSHTTIDGNGRYHTKFHVNPIGVFGFGWPSGNIYHGTGVTQWQNEGIVGAPQIFINNFRLISQGTAPNFMVHVNTHITVNANGDVTTNVDHTTMTCK